MSYVNPLLSWLGDDQFAVTMKQTEQAAAGNRGRRTSLQIPLRGKKGSTNDVIAPEL